MRSLTYSDLSKIPYFSGISLQSMGNRVFTSLPFLESSQWRLPMPVNDGLSFLQAEPADCLFITRQPTSDHRDVLIEGIDRLYRYVSWPDIHSQAAYLLDDYNNLFSSVGKLDLFHSSRIEALQSSFVTTELEYMSVVCKSIFDLVQVVAKKLWSRVLLTDPSTKKKELPDTYGRMILSDDRRLSSEDIQEKYAIPKTLADFYASTEDLFVLIKRFRDDVVHHGKPSDVIFVLPEGFAVSSETPIFSHYRFLFSPGDARNGLHSIRPLLMHWIRSMLDLFNGLTGAFSCQIPWPDPIYSLDYSIWLRSPGVASFHQMESELATSPWWNRASH